MGDRVAVVRAQGPEGGATMALHIGERFRDQIDLSNDVQAELELCQLALSSTCEGILMHRPDGTIALFNEACATNLGLTPKEFAKLPPFGWTSIGNPADAAARIERMRDPEGVTFQSELTLPDGRFVVMEVHSKLAETRFGPLVVSVSHDVTERVRAERMLHDLAFHDALTGLANRVSFDERLAAAMASADRHGDCLGVIYLDIDDFKAINDNYGHSAGDAVLIAMARRLEGAVRSEDVVARLGGDEFVVILPRLDGAADLEGVAAKLRETVGKRLKISSTLEFDLGAATGAALYDPSRDDARSLVARADIAMYESKRRARRVR